MTSAPPPPPPPIPPPLPPVAPGGLPPPMPPMAVPPPAAGVPIVPIVPLPLPPQQSHTVILTHLPSHLSDSNTRPLRDFLYPIGSQRGIHIIKNVAIVKMKTSTGAALLAKSAPVALKEFDTKAYNYGNLSRQPDAATTTATTTSNANTDTTTTTTATEESSSLVKKLIEISQRLLESKKEGGINAHKKNLTEVKKLDVSKVAAAAGGGAYDEEVDPLNAPEVLEAVAKFKKSLEERDVGMRKRRAEIVDRKISEKVKQLRSKKRQSKEEDVERQPPPPAAVAAETSDRKEQQPPPPPPPESTDRGDMVKDSGKRGVSNLPAWMTKSNDTGGGGGSEPSSSQQPPLPSSAPPPPPPPTDAEPTKKRKFTPSEANRDINARKPRLDTGGQSLTATAVSAAQNNIFETPPELDLDVSVEQQSALKKYISLKIIELLGEEESTLIQFILDQVLKKKCTPKELMGEMEAVLEEDAMEFVKELWKELIKLVNKG